MKKDGRRGVGLGKEEEPKRNEKGPESWTRKMKINELCKNWLELAELFRSHADKPPAVAYERCANELEEALKEEGDRLLTLQEASRISGYSAGHLGRAVREGKIPNAGRYRAPKICLKDLPKKAVEQLPTDGKPVHYESARTAIVQSVINPIKG